MTFRKPSNPSPIPNCWPSFTKSNDIAVDALKRYQAHFCRTHSSRDQPGDFRLGADLYRQKLLYEEMVDTPLDQLLQIGYADLRKNQQAFKETAARINPRKTPLQILDEAAAHDHPPADHLLPILPGRSRRTEGLYRCAQKPYPESLRLFFRFLRRLRRSPGHSPRHRWIRQASMKRWRKKRTST